MSVKIPLFVILPILCLSTQKIGKPAVRCLGGDVSQLTTVVHVSPQGNDSGTCGSSVSSPCKTIQQGITNCTGKSNCSVLVRYGIYNTGSPVSLTNGVSLYGGCVFDETEYQYRSTIIGNPAIRAVAINTPTAVQGFVILGSTAVHNGEASVAISASESNGLILSRNLIASGKGANGENGTTPFAQGGLQGGSAPNSTTGGSGGGACWTNPPPGVVGKGGKGANYQQLHTSWPGAKASCTNNNYPASLGEKGQSSGTVTGGDGGQRGSAGCACSGAGDNSGDGPDGQGGKTGANSTSGGSSSPDTKGSFAGAVWISSSGGTGSAGAVGSGGGGGGSGGYGANRGGDYMGYPGGGGGGGGCGGWGGTGGKAGGASIPLVLFRSAITLTPNTNLLIPGPGGLGGKGGTGARGGTGGSGQYGYRGAKYDIEQGAWGLVCKGTVPGYGGRGGTGGQGGAGSGGAGGNGGPSFAVALVNSSPLSAAGITIYPAQPGAGGEVGAFGQNDAQNKGVNGAPGNSGFSDNANSILSFTSTGQLFGGRL